MTMASNHPEAPQGAFNRQTVEDEIERLIGLLDLLDGDPDLEPSMGYLPPGILDEAEPDFDDEPSLGSLDGLLNQTLWSAGGFDDFEASCEDEGADIEDGGSGATPNMSWDGVTATLEETAWCAVYQHKEPTEFSPAIGGRT